ncbi:MAG: glycosyltransferase [Mycobacteriaceae bacterium]|nr:glycosyltransferase [Mycobacteriaceae bacterium]
MTGGVDGGFDVSVIIPTKNRRHLIDVQLVALARQDFPTAFEVIVADNGSDDGTRDHVADHPLRDRLNLRWVDASEVPGASHARNVGAQKAFGDLLLFCDDDDRVHDNWISSMAHALRADFDVVGSTARELLFDGRLADIPLIPEWPGMIGPVLGGSSIGCHAEVYRKLDGMNVEYLAGEDNDFGWRAARDGFQVGYLTEALVDYRSRVTTREAYRAGRGRGMSKAKLFADHPDHGLPPIRLVTALVTLARLAVSVHRIGPAFGMLAGHTVFEIRGGIRHRTLRWLW